MPVTRQFVETIEEIRKSLQTFNAEAAAYPDAARSLLSQTTYWVYDPDSDDFGPSKFVGFRNLDLVSYESARDGEWQGARFDGHATRVKIEKVLGEDFVPNPQLAGAFAVWAESLVPAAPGTGLFDGVDRSKWLFASLPSGSKPVGAWTPDEVAATVDDYFAMLANELSGKAYSKAAHRSKLLGRLHGRSGPAVEFKHCNISAILEDLGLPYIAGYKPRPNYQHALADAVEHYLGAHPATLQELEKVGGRVAAPSTDTQIEDVLEEAPDSSHPAGAGPHAATPAKIDWAGRDSANRALGESGEEFVAELERRHLQRIGRADLGARVEVISKTKGDGAGYDVLSFSDDGEEKYIEVKTTEGGKARPFYISATELCQSEKLMAQYWLYRVFKAAGRRKLFRVPGPLSERLDLVPTVYRGMVR